MAADGVGLAVATGKGAWSAWRMADADQRQEGESGVSGVQRQGTTTLLAMAWLVNAGLGTLPAILGPSHSFQFS